MVTDRVRTAPCSIPTGTRGPARYFLTMPFSKHYTPSWRCRLWDVRLWARSMFSHATIHRQRFEARRG